MPTRNVKECSAKLEKLGGTLVLSPKSVVEDKSSGVLLSHQPRVHGFFIHCWNFNPIVFRRVLKKAVRQLSVGNTLGANNEGDVRRARQQTTKKMVHLVDVQALAPDVVQTVDQNQEWLPVT